MNFKSLGKVFSAVFTLFFVNSAPSKNNVDFGFCNLPLPDNVSLIEPTFMVHTRLGTVSFMISNRDQIFRMVAALISDGFIRKRILFIVHGFRDTVNTPWLTKMAQALLDVENDTIFVTGWGNGARVKSFKKAAANTYAVSAVVAAVAQSIREFNSSAEYFYCIGHSFGAHVCGQAGYRFPFNRITGLDPAGPCFENCPLNIGLSNYSAGCVDVIHTDGELLGTLHKLGHVDFYPNCGAKQPCSGRFCSHHRAVDYFIETVRAAAIGLYPAAQGPCKLKFLQTCQPCTDISCLIIQIGCQSHPVVAQPIGFGSICYDGVKPKCAGNMSRQDYFGVWFVPVRTTKPYFISRLNCSVNT